MNQAGQAGSRARTLGPQQRSQRAPWGVPDDETRERLRTGFGALLRAEREARGLSWTALAERALLHRRTVVRLERGERRPRPLTVRSLARAFDPDRQEALEAALLAALGPDLAEETVASARRWERRTSAAWRTGTLPIPADVRRRIEIGQAHDTAVGALLGMLGQASAAQLDDPAFLGRALTLCEMADRFGSAVDALGGPLRSSYGERSGRPRLIGAGIPPTP